MNDSERAMLYELATRVLCLERAAGMPMSIADQLIAERVEEQRRETIEKDRRRAEAYRKACVDSERTGSREPIDRFVRELKRERVKATRPH
jgi:hypothetical protein